MPKLHLYRYQILPITRELQQELNQPSRSVDDLLAQKNELFWKALQSIQSFDTPHSTVTHKVAGLKEDFVLFRFAVSRKLDRETKDFRHEPIETWPSFVVAIWNDPERQLIAVERRVDAFQLSDTVVRLILGLVNSNLQHHNLRVHWDPLFEQHVFWDIISRNQGKIQEVTFHLVTPNMANISGTIAEDVKTLAKTTNSVSTTVTLDADPDSALNIDPANSQVAGLVDYASQGGGNIAIRIRGFRQKIETSRSTKTVEIDQLEAENPEMAIAVLKTLLGK